MINPLDPCRCEEKYSLEEIEEGKTWILYFGRCPHRHGYNLVTLSDPSFNFYTEIFLENLNRTK